MADNELIVYGFCGANCKHRVLTKDQTENLIQEMAANGFEVPDNFKPTTAVNGVKEQNTGATIKFWKGTNAEWNAWTGDKTDVYPIKTDDVTENHLEKTLNEILNGTAVVSKSINAIYAQYASTDTSKGTIEQRLTNLGFKQGSVSLSSGIAASENILTRQGNYVVGKLKITNGLYLHYLSTEDITKAVFEMNIGNIPERFRPKATYDTNMKGTVYCTGFVEGYSKTTISEVSTIYTNGTINCELYFNGGYGYLQASEAQPVTIYFGYEANPIVTDEDDRVANIK